MLKSQCIRNHIPAERSQHASVHEVRLEGGGELRQADVVQPLVGHPGVIQLGTLWACAAIYNVHSTMTP